MSFYVFLNSGLSLWAFGLRINEGSDQLTSGTPFTSKLLSATKESPGINIGDIMDYFLLATAPLTLLLYYLGASEFHTKVPIYIMMSTIFAILTSRFWQVSVITNTSNTGFIWNMSNGPSKGHPQGASH